MARPGPLCFVPAPIGYSSSPIRAARTASANRSATPVPGAPAPSAPSAPCAPCARGPARPVVPVLQPWQVEPLRLQGPCRAAPRHATPPSCRQATPTPGRQATPGHRKVTAPRNPEGSLELAVGIVVPIGDCRCYIWEPLGMGSFGVVWAGKGARAGAQEFKEDVAVKEMLCGTEAELRRAEYEIKLLETRLGERGGQGWGWQGGKVLLAAAPFFLLRLRRALQRIAAAKGKHPGTAEQRALCFNPWVAKEDFEERFIGKEDLQAEDFDFVVVGAGSAGCACAARLAKANFSVLLLEAGGEAQRSYPVQTPRKMWGLWQSEVDWGFRSEPQESLLPKGRRVDMERGKTLGGCSAINYNMWVRGAPEDFDRWEKECGCEGWGFADVLPHFKAIERMESSHDKAYESKYRGDQGPVSVATLHPPMPEVADFLRACEETGDAVNEDHNASRLPGACPVQFNTNGPAGGREDCFSAFIEPLLRWYPKLRVASETYCRKLLLDSSPQVRATGVELELRGGEIIQVKCRREVILCAGALNTPQLLMLSGVGPPEHLKTHGIGCVVPSPQVGQNLQDHPLCAAVLLGQNMAPESAMVQNTSGLNGQLFWQSETDKQREQKLGHPLGADIQIIFLNRLDSSLAAKVVLTLANSLFEKFTPDYRSDFKVTTSLLKGLVDRLLPSEALRDAIRNRLFSLTMLNNHCQSRGSLWLKSRDPHELPAVDPRWLSHPEDVAAFVEAYRRMRKIMTHPAMTKHFSPEGVKPLPEGDAPFEVIASFVRENSQTTWHYSCTTRMGPVGDPAAVCDPKARVQGVANLRVADAGLMPIVVSGNTNAACIMIGDKVGHMVAEEHRAAASLNRDKDPLSARVPKEPLRIPSLVSSEVAEGQPCRVRMAMQGGPGG
ncbi:unnamed protein product [Effrenium voratum]|nr:unnamed protein product [Effrenium voratum]